MSIPEFIFFSFVAAVFMTVLGFISYEIFESKISHFVVGLVGLLILYGGFLKVEWETKLQCLDRSEYEVARTSHAVFVTSNNFRIWSDNSYFHENVGDTSKVEICREMGVRWNADPSPTGKIKIRLNEGEMPQFAPPDAFHQLSTNR